MWKITVPKIPKWVYSKIIDTEIINNFVSLGMQWLFLIKLILSLLNIASYINHGKIEKNRKIRYKYMLKYLNRIEKASNFVKKI